MGSRASKLKRKGSPRGSLSEWGWVERIPYDGVSLSGVSNGDSVDVNKPNPPANVKKSKGKKIKRKPANEAGNFMICPNCGTDTTAEFTGLGKPCPKCGTKMLFSGLRVSEEK